jgi:hypothetical protein
MALRVAVANGNWSNPAIWNNGVLPVSGDVVASNGFTVTIDQNVNVDLLTNTVQSPVIITANMTSNTTPSGIVSASSQLSTGYLPWQAFQYSNTGDWLSTYGSVGWIAYEFPTPKVVAKYTILRSVNNNFPASTPRDWTLEAWSGTDWIILDTVTGNTGDYTADVPNTTSYIQYRVNITAINGGAYIGIREIFFYEANDYGANSVAGGGFILNSGVILTTTGTTGISYISTTPVITWSGAAGTTANIVANILRGGSGAGILITGLGTINIVANQITGNTGSGGTSAIHINSNATVNITAELVESPNSGAGGDRACVRINSNCTLNITGNLIINGTAQACVIISIGTAATINVTGNMTSSSVSPQSTVINSGVAYFLTHIGSITVTGQRPAIISTSASAINLFSGPFICSEYGFFPYQCVRMHLIPSAASYIEFRDETTGGARAPVPPAPATQLISPSTLVSNLAIADVRFGTVYAMGTLTGTLRMPTPNQVTFGVAVDDTFGNSVLTAASVWDYLVSNITVEGSIGMRLKNVATPQTIGEQLEAFLRLD